MSISSSVPENTSISLRCRLVTSSAASLWQCKLKHLLSNPSPATFHTISFYLVLRWRGSSVYPSTLSQLSCRNSQLRSS